MRLFLATVVLFLAFVAYTEAQDRSIEDRFRDFQERVTAVGSSWVEKVKTAAEDLGNSDIVVTSKNWLQKTFEDIQRRVGQ
ncbi:unnamed protein product [Tetraodon nigroviridis]|uniref:(spotted green pufferfish) hypothetical protein n=1 Tax=Tetraodon nigroviridis TaxID=99883 RepID=Q4SV29_TETNG|nr:unnamed protein product [Tetraodon nigroviridis]